MLITQSNEQSALSIDDKDVEKLVRAFIKFTETTCDEVSVNFVDKVTISSLHKEYFDDPSPTDCISFPIDDSDVSHYRVLGEVFVCPEVAKEYAHANKLEISEELSRYVIHALLHLIGYDDIEENDWIMMKKQEEALLSHMRKNHLLIRCHT